MSRQFGVPEVPRGVPPSISQKTLQREPSDLIQVRGVNPEDILMITQGQISQDYCQPPTYAPRPNLSAWSGSYSPATGLVSDTEARAQEIAAGREAHNLAQFRLHPDLRRYIP